MIYIAEEHTKWKITNTTCHSTNQTSFCQAGDIFTSCFLARILLEEGTVEVGLQRCLQRYIISCQGENAMEFRMNGGSCHVWIKMASRTVIGVKSNLWSLWASYVDSQKRHLWLAVYQNRKVLNQIKQTCTFRTSHLHPAKCYQASRNAMKNHGCYP